MDTLGQRICVVGCCGAGKSTLSMRLAEKTGLPVVHLDQLYWKPGWVACTNEEMDDKLARAVAEPKWIIDGNFKRTMAQRFSRATGVVYLDYSRIVCVKNILKRVSLNLGKEREDMAAGCPERFDWDFIKYVWSFRKRNDAYIRELLATYEKRGVKVVILRSRARTEKWFCSL